MLTGLDFSERKVRPLDPVAPVRGWPADLSDLTRRRLLSWSDDTAFGRSWLAAPDLAAYDWDAPLTWTFMASPPPDLAVDDEARSRVGLTSTSITSFLRGWAAAGWSRHGFDVSMPTTPREQVGRFLDAIEAMTDLAADDLHSVRCGFEFTR